MRRVRTRLLSALRTLVRRTRATLITLSLGPFDSPLVLLQVVEFYSAHCGIRQKIAFAENRKKIMHLIIFKRIRGLG